MAANKKTQIGEKRKLKSWLTTYLKHILPVSESPESFLIWSGLFCLSTVTKRKIRFSREFTKKYTIYPTMYLMFVAPPGVSRKTTTAGYAQDIIREMNEVVGKSDLAHVNLGPSSASASAIIEKIANTLDGSLSIIAGEFGNLVSVSPEITYDFFAKMFDHEVTYEHATRQHGSEGVINPSLNILGCTTPDWMANNAGYITGGGFAARTVFIFEHQARQRRLFYYGAGEKFEELERIKKDLAHDLAIIGQLKGEFKPIDKKLADEMEDWYQSFEQDAPSKSAETFRERKHIHVIRTAMLLSLSEGNSMVINKDHFDASVELCDNVEKKLSRGLMVASKNPYVQEHFKILDYIIAHGPVLRSKVHAAFWQDVRDPHDFAAIIEVLKSTGEIEEIDYGAGETKLRKAAS